MIFKYFSKIFNRGKIFRLILLQRIDVFSIAFGGFESRSPPSLLSPTPLLSPLLPFRPPSLLPLLCFPLFFSSPLFFALDLPPHRYPLSPRPLSDLQKHQCFRVGVEASIEARARSKILRRCSVWVLHRSPCLASGNHEIPTVQSLRVVPKTACLCKFRLSSS